MINESGKRQRRASPNKSTNLSGDHIKHRRLVTPQPVPVSDETPPLAELGAPSGREPWSERFEINLQFDEAAPPLDNDAWSERDENNLQLTHAVMHFGNFPPIGFAPQAPINITSSADGLLETTGPSYSLQQTLLEFAERPELSLRASG